MTAGTVLAIWLLLLLGIWKLLVVSSTFNLGRFVAFYELVRSVLFTKLRCLPFICFARDRATWRLLRVVFGRGRNSFFVSVRLLGTQLHAATWVGTHHVVVQAAVYIIFLFYYLLLNIVFIAPQGPLRALTQQHFVLARNPVSSRCRTAPPQRALHQDVFLRERRGIFCRHRPALRFEVPLLKSPRLVGGGILRGRRLHASHILMISRGWLYWALIGPLGGLHGKILRLSRFALRKMPLQVHISPTL